MNIAVNNANQAYTEALDRAKQIYDPAKSYASVQYAFAYLQLEFSEVNKLNTKRQIESLERSQDLSHSIGDVTTAMRNVQNIFNTATNPTTPPDRKSVV